MQFTDCMSFVIVLSSVIPVNKGIIMTRPTESVFITGRLFDQANQITWDFTEKVLLKPEPNGVIDAVRGNERVKIFNKDSEDFALIIQKNGCWNSMDKNISLFKPPNKIKDKILSKGLYYFYDDHLQSGNQVTFYSNYISRSSNIAGSTVNFNFYFANRIWENSNLTITELRKIDISWQEGYGWASTRHSLQFNNLAIKIGQKLQISTNIPLGIGCPMYLAEVRTFPVQLLINQYYVKMSTKTINQRSQLSYNSEALINTLYEISRVKYFDQGVLKELIVDYNIGIYWYTMSKCKIDLLYDQPLTLAKGPLKFNEIAWMNNKYNYVGTYSNFSVWESTEYNQFIDNTFYDKVVTTQFIESQPNNTGIVKLLSNYKVERNLYFKIIKGNIAETMREGYVLVETQGRNFSDFSVNFTKTGNLKSFAADQCNENDKIWLIFEIGQTDSSEMGTSKISDDKESLEIIIRRLIINYLHVSFLRITSMDFAFNGTVIKVNVTIIETINILHSLKKTYKRFSMDSLNHFEPLRAKNDLDCLRLAGRRSDIKYVLNRLTNLNLCIGIHLEQSLPKENENGPAFMFFDNSFGKLSRLLQEAMLQDIPYHASKLIGLPLHLESRTFQIINAWVSNATKDSRVIHYVHPENPTTPIIHVQSLPRSASFENQNLDSLTVNTVSNKQKSFKKLGITVVLILSISLGLWFSYKYYYKTKYEVTLLPGTSSVSMSRLN